MFNQEYQERSKKIVEYLLDLFNHKYFASKSILDLGAGYGDIGAAFSKSGSNVIAIDAREEYLKKIAYKYSNIKTIKADLDSTLVLNSNVDIALFLGTLCHLKNYEKALKQVCSLTQDLILETAVVDSDNIDLSFEIKEHAAIYGSSFNGLGNRVSAAKIERILSSCGMKFIRVDDGRLNHGKFIYDWEVANSNKTDLNLRRFWIASKNASTINQINKQVSRSINKVKQQINKNIVPRNINLSTDNEDKNISIIVPARNAQSFIYECLDSVFKQNIKNIKYEILIGIDNCQSTLNYIKNKDNIFNKNNIKIYYFNENLGPYIIKNTLADYAQYDNLLFFDADDIMHEDMLSTTINELKKSSIVRYKFYNFKHGNNHKIKSKPEDFYAAGVMGIKKDLFNKHNGFEGWLCAADYEFNERMKHFEEKESLVDSRLFYRRIHNSNLEFSKETGINSKIRENYLSEVRNKHKFKNFNLSKKKISSNFNLVFEEKLTKEIVNVDITDNQVSNTINKIKVYHFIPWSTDKNLGKCYNEFMELLKEDNDWACFLDGDAVHTTTYFGRYIEEVIKENPSYDLFTCYTNRVGAKYQLAPGSDWNNDSQKNHRELGENLWNQFGTKVEDITNNTPLSGVLILINKKIWSYVGGFKEEKMLSVDNDIHEKVRYIGGKIALMKGVYVQHWYRGGDKSIVSHLK